MSTETKTTPPEQPDAQPAQRPAPRKHLRTRAENGILIVQLDVADRPVNVMTHEFADELEGLIDELALQQQHRGVIICSAKPGNFIAGADIDEFGAIASADEATALSRRGQSLMQKLEDLPMAVVAAIDGSCLGGGCELAMACHFRIATDDPKTMIGLPETKLGILPGWGGTQRMVRLIGLSKALDMILAGKVVPAAYALRIGLVDDVVPTEILLRTAAEAVDKLGGRRRTPRAQRHRAKGLLAWFIDRTPLGHRLALRQATKTTAAKSRSNYPALPRSIDCIRLAAQRDYRRGFQLEAAALGQLMMTPESQNLRHVFFLQQAAKRDPGVPAANIKPLNVSRAGIVGAGFMGGAIAHAFSASGWPVRIKDLNEQALAAGLSAADRIFNDELKRRRRTRLQVQRAFERISPTTTYAGFAKLDLIVEAVVERLDVKQQVFKELDGMCDPKTILATNTSSLPIGQIAPATRRPDKVVGMHFFSPVEKMPLVEIIRSPHTSDETVATIVAVAKKLGKTPVVVNDGPGFLVNRILSPYMTEAGHLVTEGAPIHAIDEAALDFGMPVGPLKLLDEVGLDVAAHVGRVLQEALGERMRPAPVLAELMDRKWLGRKSGRGIYLYPRKKRKAKDLVNPDLAPLITHARKQSGVGLRETVSRDEIIARLIYPMINEAARCLADHIARSPSDVDLAMIFGTGFAPFRGGLLRYADSIGADRIVQQLHELSQRVGARFEPSQPLVEMASSNGKFYQ